MANMFNLVQYTIAVLVIMAVIALLVSLLKEKVWISVKNRRERMLRIGYLEQKNEDEVPEVRLTDKSTGASLGRVKLGDTDDNTYVELITTDPDDDSVQPVYATVGYVTQEAYIYKYNDNKRKKATCIGYLAQESKPDVPCVEGKRTWRNLWLTSTLQAYEGKPNDEVKRRIPVSVASRNGLRSSKNEMMPLEARAAAFGLLFSKCNKRDYSEHYGSPAHGWKDTAMLSAIIYAVIYCIAYIFVVKIGGDRFIGYAVKRAIPLFLSYFALWAAVRAIKIEMIERSDTIQPKLDLFNKSLGQHTFDILIFISCIIILLLTGSNYYHLDFLPLAAVVLIATIINNSLRSVKSPWKVKNPFKEPEDVEESDVIENPRGDIRRDYDWTLDSDLDIKVTGHLTLYFDSTYVRELRQRNPFYNQRNDKPLMARVAEMFKFVIDRPHFSARLRYTARRIAEITGDNNLPMLLSLQLALDFVQEPNIRFCNNIDSDTIQNLASYIRFPEETLFDKEGDSFSKSLLAATLLHYLGYDVLYAYSRRLNHAVVGVALPSRIEIDEVFGKPIEEVTFRYNDKKFIVLETTGEKFLLGQMFGSMRLDDFDEKVEFPISIDNTEVELTRKCIYNWQLDSAMGNSLKGNLTLEFDPDEMDELRQSNPFLSYGKDSHSYEDNIRSMVKYLDEDSQRYSAIDEVAAYIKKTVKSAKLSDLDMLQFALDFCQEPNITYIVDEYSEPIKYAKEYMRYPDEVLYDKEGDCDCKSSLTSALFRSLGFDVLFLLSEKLAHAGIAVEYNPEWRPYISAENEDIVIREHEGKQYVYCETTGDHFKIGNIKDGSSIADFEIAIHLPARN